MISASKGISSDAESSDRFGSFWERGQFRIVSVGTCSATLKTGIIVELMELEIH